MYLSGPTCSISADEQMKTLLNHLNTNCKEAWSGRVWLDIEGTQYWTGDTENNRVWYQVKKKKRVNYVFIAFVLAVGICVIV